MAQLINIADVIGEYQDMEIADTTQLSVELSALSITKSANKAIWLDGELTYKIDVKNVDTAVPGDPVTSVVFKDTIDPAIATLIINSVTVDGDAKVEGVDFDYDPTSGLLTIPLEDIDPGVTVEISFRVERVL